MAEERGGGPDGQEARAWPLGSQLAVFQLSQQQNAAAVRTCYCLSPPPPPPSRPRLPDPKHLVCSSLTGPRPRGSPLRMEQEG